MTTHTHARSELRSDGGAVKKPAVIAIVAMLAALVALPVSPARGRDVTTVRLIVREAVPSTGAAESLVEALGGTVGEHLTLIGGFLATVPADVVPAVVSSPVVASATPDGTVRFAGYNSRSNRTNRNHNSWEDDKSGRRNAGNSVYMAAYSTGARAFWASGYTGQGVDVALIDSGVAPVEGLATEDKVVNALDLSFDALSPGLRFLDGYGHGTHMASIIGGRDTTIWNPGRYWSRDLSDSAGFIGMAPDARIINVKVGDHEGATDVSQVIAALDWVVQNKTSNGMNIRVVNLSFGTDSDQSYILDPVSFAVEQAWKAGIVVVVAAGNDGNDTALRNPAADPLVIAAGASDLNGTADLADDNVARFSNCGTASRSVDLVAPGVSIRGLRVPGGMADTEYPDAAVDGRFFKGTGTSQAAAMVSGAAALIISQRPEVTPDQVKELLLDNARTLTGESSQCQGAGELNLRSALRATTPRSRQSFTPSTGTGSLEAARGTDHLTNNGVVLSGEIDIFGNPVDTAKLAELAAEGAAWVGTSWNDSSWAGLSWSGVSWSGVSWSGLSWSGTSWSGMTWTGVSWSGTSWSGTSWSGTSWSDSAWLGQSWG